MYNFIKTIINIKLFIRNKQGITIILVTHNEEIAKKVGNIYQMKDGYLLKE